MRPDVSVIVPVFQVKNYIGDCLKSILLQQDVNIEVIVIDDGSTDGSSEICDKMSEEDKRIIVIHTENNGVSEARNIGIKYSKGEWICFVDGDDYVSENMVRDLIEILPRDHKKNPPDIIIGDYYSINDSGVRKEFFYKNKTVFYENEKTVLIWDSMLGKRELTTNVGVPWGKLYNRMFLVKHNLHFVPGLKRMQDTIFNLYAFSFAGEIHYIHKPIYYYRTREDSAVHKYSPDYCDTINLLLNEFTRFSKSIGCTDFSKIQLAKQISLFLDYCKLDPCHQDNTKSFFEKIASIRREDKKLISKESLKVWQLISFKLRITVVLSLCRAEILLYILLKISMFIK